MGIPAGTLGVLNFFLIFFSLFQNAGRIMPQSEQERILPNAFSFIIAIHPEPHSFKVQVSWQSKKERG
jgi:hypothetical protein